MQFKQSTLRGALCSAAVLLSACGGSSSSGNSGPVFGQTSYDFSVTEDTAYNGSVTATDSDGDTLAYTVQTSPTMGTLSVNADGTFVYTPADNLFGDDTATVNVTDGEVTVSAVLNFSIAAVNDVPVIDSVSIIADVDGETLNGQIDASDVDGDILSYSIAQAPGAGTLTINDDGSFDYVLESVTSTANEFTVQIDDGNDGVLQQVIALQSSYATNEQRRAYYYASDVSHLRTAENRILLNGDDDAETITDTTVAADVYVNIAEGYALNGYVDEALALVEENIASLKTQGDAYRAIGQALNSIEEFEQANNARELATAAYNQYISGNGVANMASSDASSLMGVVRDYNEAGADTQAQALLDVILGYYDQLGGADEESSTTRRYLAVAMESYVATLLENYLDDVTDANHDLLVEYIGVLGDMASDAGYRSTSRFARYEIYKAMYSGYVATYYYLASLPANTAADLEKAREWLAKTTAYYSAVNYDDSYALEADANAESTLAGYATGLHQMSGLFAALYPAAVAFADDGTQTGNVPLTILLDSGKSHSSLSNAYRYIFSYGIAARIADGEEQAAVMAAPEAYYSEVFTSSTRLDKLRQAAVEFGAVTNKFNIGAAAILNYQGDHEASVALLEYALTLVQSDDYTSLNSTSVSDLIGSTGCGRVAWLINQQQADSTAYQDDLAQCQTLAANTLLPSSGDTYSYSKALESIEYLMLLWNDAGNADQVAANVDIANNIIAELQTSESDEYDYDATETYAQSLLQIANAHLAVGNLSEARTAYGLAMDSVDALVGEESLDEEGQLDQLNDIINAIVDGEVTSLDASSSWMALRDYRLGVQYLAGVADSAEYQTTIQNTDDRLQQLYGSLITQASGFADGAKLEAFENLVDSLANAGLYDTAASLAVDAIHSTTETEALLQVIAKAEAIRDQFPAQTIAAVDTDLDGYPNFFLPNVEIVDDSAEGLVLDADDDGDGINNPQDVYPLIPGS